MRQSKNPKFEIRNSKQNMKGFKKINESGFTLMVVFAAVLVLFTTFSFIKLGSLDRIDPDLRRIGINIGPQASANPLADDQTTSPNQADSQTGNANQTITLASDALNLDADVDIESEGDSVAYIE